MNGIMYYLKKDVPLQRGHTIFIDSDWSLTAISQAQFWQAIDLDDYGRGDVDGIRQSTSRSGIGPASSPGRRRADEPARRSLTRCGVRSRTTSTTAR